MTAAVAKMQARIREGKGAEDAKKALDILRVSEPDLYNKAEGARWQTPHLCVGSHSHPWLRCCGVGSTYHKALFSAYMGLAVIARAAVNVWREHQHMEALEPFALDFQGATRAVLNGTEMWEHVLPSRLAEGLDLAQVSPATQLPKVEATPDLTRMEYVLFEGADQLRTAVRATLPRSAADPV